MAPKKRTKASLKKAGTMAATAAAGREFLKQAWGEEKLNRVNALMDARSQSDTSTDDEAPSAPSTTAARKRTTKAKPKLSKARTMKSTAKEAKALLGKQVLGDTRADTKRRQAAVKASKTLKEVTKPTSELKKPGIKRLGTMAKTAQEGTAYIKRTARKGKSTTGRKRTGRQAKKTTK